MFVFTLGDIVQLVLLATIVVLILICWLRG
nr:MAG TPA: cellulose biosynthesis protein [Caudoviricetes sp.]